MKTSRVRSIVQVLVGLSGLMWRLLGATLYVWSESPDPKPPYTNWTTAARVIQDAVDAASAGDEVVVTNGVYATGGRAVDAAGTNRVAVTKPLTLRSVNGPEFTVIEGYQVPGTTNGTGAVRCVYLADGASLSGFTLTKGATRTSGEWPTERSGGGVCCASTNAVVTNCVLVGNSAWYGGGAYRGTLYNCSLTDNYSAGGGGGGAYESTLYNCTLTGNVAARNGGGAYRSTLYNCTLTCNSAESGGGALYSTLYNCTLTGNSAEYGGGARDSTLHNSTVTGNSARRGGGVYGSTACNSIVCYNMADFWENYSDSTLNYCCTTPLPLEGVGNIHGDPKLVSSGHIALNSPCCGAGNAAYATGVDIDGEPWASPPSIGCDEVHPEALTGPLALTIQASF
ncbi:MAG: hypothetical protein GX456_07940, partial [Verrucomicrobia bacterium]|nr:hypothetical protein [Verrucomicrobiota bacterium]